MNPAADIAAVSDPKRLAALLGHPLRTRLVALASKPASASQLAARLRMPRQRVNYHVRQLASAGFLRRAGQLRKRNLIEQQYVATARAYVLAPEVLGPLAASGQVPEDAFSAVRLIGLASEAQADLAAALRESSAHGKRLATLSLSADLRFESADQRVAFTRALQHAVTDVIAKHSAPTLDADGSPGAGRPFKLLVGCYPSVGKPRGRKQSTEKDGR